MQKEALKAKEREAERKAEEAQAAADAKQSSEAAGRQNRNAQEVLVAKRVALENAKAALARTKKAVALQSKRVDGYEAELASNRHACATAEAKARKATQDAERAKSRAMKYNNEMHWARPPHVPDQEVEEFSD